MSTRVPDLYYVREFALPDSFVWSRPPTHVGFVHAGIQDQHACCGMIRRDQKVLLIDSTPAPDARVCGDCAGFLRRLGHYRRAEHIRQPSFADVLAGRSRG